MRTSLVSAIVLSCLVTASTLCAQDQNWVVVHDTPTTTAISINKASIKSIDRNTVRAWVRLKRKPRKESEKVDMYEVVDYLEFLADYDCNKPRQKVLIIKAIGKDKNFKKEDQQDQPEYKSFDENNTFNTARKYACKAKGKMR